MTDTPKHTLTHKQRLALLLGSAGGAVAIVAAVLIGVGIYSTSATADNTSAPTSLSANVQDTSVSGTLTSGQPIGSDEDATDDADSPETAPPSDGSTTPSGSGAEATSVGGSASAPVWHEGWDEEVWVQSGYNESRAYEFPINGMVGYDGTPLPADFNSWPSEQATDWMISHGGGYKNGIIGYRTEYHDFWVDTSHWETVHHEGYWG